MAREWRSGVMPGAGGVGNQPAWLVAAINIVLTAWGKLERAREAARKPK